MSTGAAMETEVRQVLADLRAGEAKLLASVGGHPLVERQALVAAIGREATPAAYVGVVERRSRERSAGLPGAVTLSVVLATRSHRSVEEARTGPGGMGPLAEAVARALHDRALAGGGRLTLREERPVGLGEGLVVWEQRYELYALTGSTVPTFGGVALAGPLSRVQVEPGELRRAATTFAFPGVDGLFERVLGLRDRPIVWRGQLRAANGQELDAIEAGLEQAVGEAGERPMVDAWGRVYERCVLRRFVRRGPRCGDDVLGGVAQEFELEFAELGR